LLFFTRRVLGVGLLTFFLSLAFSAFFRLTRAVVPFWFSTGILLIVVLLGIVFDIVGTAVTAAQEAPFHAMASDRVTGARTAMAMVRNADRVASFCNDVVGDICGTVSGAIGSALVIDLVIHYQVFRYEDLISIIMVGLVAAVTVGGKAWGKAFAIQRANFIILQVGKAFENGRRLFGLKENNKKRRGNRKQLG
jgi:CBS domain containing-hemolysin-like protein